MIRIKFWSLIFLLFTTVNVFAGPGGGQVTIYLGIPKFTAIAEPSSSIDYAIGNTDPCTFPRICNADLTYPYAPKPIGYVGNNPISLPLPPDWRSINWQCTLTTCINAQIPQSALATYSAEIRNNYIYATITNGANVVEVLQTSAPIPKGWSCSVSQDPSTQAPILSCTSPMKTLWLCQQGPSYCNGGKHDQDFDCKMGVTQYSYIAGILTPTGKSAGIGTYHLRDTVNFYPPILLSGASFSGKTLKCDYTDSNGNPSSWTGKHDISGLKNCSIFTGTQGEGPIGVQCDPK